MYFTINKIQSTSRYNLYNTPLEQTCKEKINTKINAETNHE